MPWSVVRKGEQFCVVKDSDGTSEGCHATKEEAEAQLAALYSSEKMSAEEWESAMSRYHKGEDKKPKKRPKKDD